MNHQGDYLITPNQSWAALRAAGVEDAATALDPSATDMDLSAQSGLIVVQDVVGRHCNGVELAVFTPSDADGDTFGMQLFAWRAGINGPGCLVFATAAAGGLIGTAKCAVHPVSGIAQANGLWCDSLTITDHWGGVSIIDHAQNGVCRVRFDLRGFAYLKAHVFAADGTAITCGSVGIVISGY